MAPGTPDAPAPWPGRAEIAEALGTFALVFVGAGAIMADAHSGTLGHVGVSLAFGLVVLAMVYALGRLSGAHLNPAVTIAFAVSGHFPCRRVASYVVAQVVGATAAALSLRALVGPIADMGATHVRGVSLVQAFGIEVLATFWLAFVIVAVATDPRVPRAATGLAIGAAVAMGALMAGPFTGGSMNPARTIGPAIASGVFAHLWLYLAAPVAGAIVAMLAHGRLRAGKTPAVADADAAAGSDGVAAGRLAQEEPA